MHRLLTIAFVLLLASVAVAHTLTVNVVDDVTGEHLAFRGSCTDAGDTERWPLPATSCYKHGASSVWRVWWIIDSPCTLSIPAGGEGNVTVRAGHGFEYRPDTLVVSVTADTETTLRLTPLTDMSTLGWYSGDPEADFGHGPVVYTCDEQDALFNCRAEGMNVFNAEEGGTVTGVPFVDGDCVCYVTYEMRHQRLGHLCPMGATARPDSITWATNLAPTLYDIADSMAAAGPSPKLVILQNHPSEYQPSFRETNFTANPGGGMWPREAIVDAYYDKLDAYDIMFLSDGYTATRYHHMLSSGIKLTATGGTDSALSTNTAGPTGSIKTYAYTPDFDYWHWIAAIEAGRTFATNGPLFTAWTVDGEMPGTTIAFDNLAAEILPIVVAFDSAYPVKRLDYLVNGSRVGGRVFTTAKTSWDTTDASGVTVQHGGAWVSGKLIGDDPGWFICAKDTMTAETSPVYVTMGGLGSNVCASATWCAGWCDSLIKITKWMNGRGTATWATSADSARALGLYRDARTGYNAKGARATFIIDPDGGGDYTSIALAIAGDANANDTLILVDGVHTDPGTTAIPTGMTIRSLGPDHRDACTIKNTSATVQALLIDAGPCYFRDLTFRTFVVYTGSNTSFVRATDLGQGVFNNCRWAYCRNSNAGAAPACVHANDTDALRFFSCEFDSCAATGAGSDYGLGWFEDVADLIFKDCRFTRNSAVDRAPLFVYHTGATDSTLFERCLIYGNSSANYGFVRVYDNVVVGKGGNTNVFDGCTFVDNTCTDATDGPANFEGANQIGYFDHCIITGGNGVAIDATYQPDYTRYCDAWNNDGTETLFAATDSTDCISVDPEYTTTVLGSPSAYKASSEYPKSGTSQVRSTADGSYMGWLRPPGLLPKGDAGRRRRH